MLSPGDDGKVKQSNDVSSEANASNDASTKQNVDQDQHGSSCGCHGSDGLALQVAGQESSTEQGASAVLAHLGLEPLLDLNLRLGEGSGACLALPVLQAAAKILREMSTFDAAGVTDKQ